MDRPYRITLGVIGMTAGALVLAWLLFTLRTFLLLVIIALVIAAALDRPVNWTQRRLHLGRRGAAVAIVFLLGFGALGGLGYLAYKPVASQGRTLRVDLPSRIERVKDIPIIGPRLKDVDIKGATERFFADLPNRLKGNRDLILGVAQTALTVLVLTLTTLVIVIFMLLNGPRTVNGAQALILDPGKAARARRLGRASLDAVAGYVLGNLLISVCAAAVTFVSLEVMRAPFAGVLAGVMFVMDLIPLVGATLGGTLVTLSTFVLDPHPWKALTFVVIFVTYQQIENHTLAPVILGRAVKLSSFAVFLMTLAGTQLAGIVGALLAIPVGAALNAVVQDILAERRRRNPRAGPMASPAA